MNNFPLLMTGTDVTGSPIFLKFSTFPDVGELTIKYPFRVTEYIFPEPMIKPVISVDWFLFFNIFKILVEEIISPVSKLIITNFPEYYYLFAINEFTYNNIKQFNRNKLISLDGFDGLKTGRTSQSGYGIVASAKRENRRIVSVVNGLNSEKERINETKKLVNWSFREFVNYDLYKSGDSIHFAKVWLGKESFVPLVLNEDLSVTIKKKNLDKFKIKLVYETPIVSPVKKGDKLAELQLIEGDNVEIKNIYSGKDVDKVSRFYRSFSIINYLLLIY